MSNLKSNHAIATLKLPRAIALLIALAKGDLAGPYHQQGDLP
jgi:hypothetical protein